MSDRLLAAIRAREGHRKPKPKPVVEEKRPKRKPLPEAREVELAEVEFGGEDLAGTDEES